MNLLECSMNTVGRLHPPSQLNQIGHLFVKSPCSNHALLTTLPTIHEVIGITVKICKLRVISVGQSVTYYSLFTAKSR